MSNPSLVEALRRLAAGSMAGFPKDTCLAAIAEIERLEREVRVLRNEILLDELGRVPGAQGFGVK